mgnify:CR=1 FL=1
MRRNLVMNTNCSPENQYLTSHLVKSLWNNVYNLQFIGRTLPLEPPPRNWKHSFSSLELCEYTDKVICFTLNKLRRDDFICTLISKPFNEQVNFQAK